MAKKSKRIKRVYTDEDDVVYWQKKALINRIRQATRFWPAKKLALDRAKVTVQIGVFKNGSPKYKTKYSCAKCRKLFEIIQTQVDHIRPIVSTSEGFTTWGEYIDNALCRSTNLQVLCIGCHEVKTAKEQKERKKNYKK